MWEFDLINTAIRTIWKSRIKIICMFEHNGLRIKRFQKPEPNDANIGLLKWFKQQRSE
jgi:hypothetical protein